MSMTGRISPWRYALLLCALYGSRKFAFREGFLFDVIKDV